jgi:transposase
MLVGRRYRLDLGPEQADYAARVASICRAVWNAALEQRRAAAKQRHSQPPSYASQCRELAEAKHTEAWLVEAPSHCLQQTLRDLGQLCAQHGVWRVHWRSKRRWMPAFRFPDPTHIGTVRRLGRNAGEVRLPKLGTVRFRWSRPLNGTIRNVTIQHDRYHWFIAFCVDDGQVERRPNELPPVGVDRGVVVPVATSDGECFSGLGMRPRRQRRLAHLQRRLARQQMGSNRRRRTVRAIGRLYEHVRDGRLDFCHQTSHALTTTHGLIVIEDLHVRAMTTSASGTVEQPGTRVRQKAGLNRSVLDKAWGQLCTTLEWHGRKTGCSIMAVPAAFTSQTCSICGHCAGESRKSQADFHRIACGYQMNADVNAARVILAAGLAASGRGGFRVAGPVKRQPPAQDMAHVAV